MTTKLQHDNWTLGGNSQRSFVIQGRQQRSGLKHWEPHLGKIFYLKLDEHAENSMELLKTERHRRRSSQLAELARWSVEEADLDWDYAERIRETAWSRDD